MKIFKTTIYASAVFAALLGLAATPAAADQVILDDLIVDGSICAGLDCVNGESFGFDTLRLKENNLRIRFFDTSSSASFPTNDWQITANDSTNGGANKFSIDDIDGGRTPFTIEAGAPSHSLYVDDGGKLGLGTSTPVVEIEIKDGDTPTLRLCQDGSSGFAAQAWDVAGNEANFFIRDVTNGSTLPFRIRPGAPTSAIDIAGGGNVGIGSASPGFPLHVRKTGAHARVETTDAGTAQRTLLSLLNNGRTRMLMIDTSNDNRWFNGFGASPVGSFVLDYGAGAAFGNQEFVLEPTGDLTIQGTLTELMSSSREIKKGFAEVDPASVLERVVAMPISEWSYKKDPDEVRHVGPMAEDFVAMFGLGENDKTIAPRDVAGVALAAIQGLNAELEDAYDSISELTERLAALEARLADESSE